jgi:hypothetical protein
MAKGTFASKTFGSRTFTSVTWAGPRAPASAPPIRIVYLRWSLAQYLLRWNVSARTVNWNQSPQRTIVWRATPMAALGQEFSMVRGEDIPFPCIPDVPTNITGWWIRWMLRATSGGTVSVTKDNGGTGGLVITDALNGIFTVSLAKADTSGLTIQTTPWFWEARRYDNGASTCLAQGTLTIAQEQATP